MTRLTMRLVFVLLLAGCAQPQVWKTMTPEEQSSFAAQEKQREAESFKRRADRVIATHGPICDGLGFAQATEAGRAQFRILSVKDGGADSEGALAYQCRLARRSTNLDGLIVYRPPDKEGAWSAYTQVFRNGILEAGRFGFRVSDASKQAIPAFPISAFVREAITKFLHASRSFGFSGPAMAGLALFSVKDYEFVLPQQFFEGSDKADRDVMLFPESWLNDMSTANADEVARPILDMLWQAFGIERCYAYDDKGNWQPR